MLGYGARYHVLCEPRGTGAMNRRPKVLLVDDEPFIANAVTRVLDGGGFDVVACSEWTEVARAVRVEKPNVVLLDYNMPGLKGDSICAILKRNAAHPGMHIVLFSSEPPAELEAIAVACGADGFIPKSAHGEELVNHVARHCFGTRSPQL